MGKNKGGRSGAPANSHSNALSSSIPKATLLIPLLAALAYHLFNLSNAIDRVDVTDQLALREYFYGEGKGGSYVLLCHEENSDRPVSSTFEGASKIVDKQTAEFKVRVFILRCRRLRKRSAHTTPWLSSGRTRPT